MTLTIPSHAELDPQKVLRWRRLQDQNAPLSKHAIIATSKYVPHKPTPKQALYLRLGHLDALFGGAAGGGKSDALLMAALQYVHVPGYNALIIRRTFSDLAMPGAIMDRALTWLAPWIAAGEVKWHQGMHRFTFPSGATLTFGFLQNKRDQRKYQGLELQFVGVDETTQFPEAQIRWLFRLLRKPNNNTPLARIPLRFRGATNPGDIGHEWVFRRYVDERTRKAGSAFVPAFLEDNPHINQEAYDRSLRALGQTLYLQLRRGRWDVKPQGRRFKRDWYEILDALPNTPRAMVRFWDLAATGEEEAADAGVEADYTAGVLMAVDRFYRYHIVDVKRARRDPAGVEALIGQTARIDGKRVQVVIEQEPGAGGKFAARYLVNRTLRGFAAMAIPARGDQGERVMPFQITSRPPASEPYGNISLIAGPWMHQFLDEVESYPVGLHDDQVVAAAGAYNYLAGLDLEQEGVGAPW